jgi:hypothetical protein
VILVLEIVKTVASLQEFYYYYPHKKHRFTPYPSNGSVNKAYSAGDIAAPYALLLATVFIIML